MGCSSPCAEYHCREPAVRSPYYLTLLAMAFTATVARGACNSYDVVAGAPNTSGTINLSKNVGGMTGNDETANWIVSPAPQYVNGQYAPRAGASFTGSDILCWDLGTT